MKQPTVPRGYVQACMVLKIDRGRNGQAKAVAATITCKDRELRRASPQGS